jgi:two-component system cell cycle sensor histidine kinase/response regulator CckA
MQPTVDSPAQSAARQNATDPSTVAGAPTAPRVRVMVVDDNEEFQLLVKQLLEPLGYEVQLISNPVKALEIYTREKENIDLVLLDYYMPTLDGGKTFEWLRKLNPNVKVIICSGAEELRLRQLQAQHAIDAYIHKPFRIDEAVFVIRKVMAKTATRR